MMGSRKISTKECFWTGESNLLIPNARCMYIRPYFFNTWFTDFFSKILRSEEGKK